MKLQYQIRNLLAMVGAGALSSCSQWIQQTEGYGPLTPGNWCHKNAVYNNESFEVINHLEYCDLKDVAPYKDYIKRPVILQRELFVFNCRTLYDPDSYGLMETKGDAVEGRFSSLPKGCPVIIHCVQGQYKYVVNKKTGDIKKLSNDVVALVEFVEPWTHKIVYGKYKWSSQEGARGEKIDVLHRYLKRAPWEPSSVPRLRAIQGPGYLVSKNENDINLHPSTQKDEDFMPKGSV